MIKNNNFRLFSMLILGVLFVWGMYVLYMNRPTSVSTVKTRKVVTLQKEDATQQKVIEKGSIKSVLLKKVLQTPNKMMEKKMQKLKPHHLYVKSDTQIKREFEKRRAEHKKFKLLTH